MIYRAGGNEAIHGGHFSTLIVEDDVELAAALEAGWFLTTTEARAPKVEAVIRASDDDAPPTRAELEQKANELGLKFDGRTGDKKLGDMIAAALKA